MWNPTCCWNWNLYLQSSWTFISLLLSHDYRVNCICFCLVQRLSVWYVWVAFSFIVIYCAYLDSTSSTRLFMFSYSEWTWYNNAGDNATAFQNDSCCSTSWGAVAVVPLWHCKWGIRRLIFAFDYFYFASSFKQGNWVCTFSFQIGLKGDSFRSDSAKRFYFDGSWHTWLYSLITA